MCAVLNVHEGVFDPRRQLLCVGDIIGDVQLKERSHLRDVSLWFWCRVAPSVRHQGRSKAEPEGAIKVSNVLFLDGAMTKPCAV